MSKQIALQLYSLREYVGEDPVAMLKKVKDCGFTAVEFAGYYDMKAQDLKAVLCEIGLEPLSSHAPYQHLSEKLDEVVAYSSELGLKYVICPYAEMKTLEDVETIAAVLNKAQEALAPHGIRVGYHNHHFEFEVVDGKYLMDHLKEAFAHEGMVTEIDTCWVRYAGADPASYIDSLGAYAGPVHLKELGANFKPGSKEDLDVQIGKGIVDFKSVLAALAKNGTLERGVVVEQEGFDQDPYVDLAAGVAYLLSVWPA